MSGAERAATGSVAPRRGGMSAHVVLDARWLRGASRPLPTPATRPLEYNFLPAATKAVAPRAPTGAATDRRGDRRKLCASTAADASRAPTLPTRRVCGMSTASCWLWILLAIALVTMFGLLTLAVFDVRGAHATAKIPNGNAIAARPMPGPAPGPAPRPAPGPASGPTPEPGLPTVTAAPTAPASARPAPERTAPEIRKLSDCVHEIGGIQVSFARNGRCDDGGEGATSNLCAVGHDWPDCPARLVSDAK
jgi:hypothetical protein